MLENENKNKFNDLTDLTEFNKSIGSSRGVGSIGLRNNKTLFEKTDVIVRSILAQTGKEISFNLTSFACLFYYFNVF